MDDNLLFLFSKISGYHLNSQLVKFDKAPIPHCSSFHRMSPGWFIYTFVFIFKVTLCLNGINEYTWFSGSQQMHNKYYNAIPISSHVKIISMCFLDIILRTQDFSSSLYFSLPAPSSFFLWSGFRNIWKFTFSRVTYLFLTLNCFILLLVVIMNGFFTTFSEWLLVMCQLFILDFHGIQKFAKIVIQVNY